MLRPFLLVGIGGSGGKTLRVVREDLQRRLAQAGWKGRFPDAWQFLHIDVPTTADGDEPDLPEQLPEANYQGLIGSGIDYRTVDDSLLQLAGSNAVDALGSWRPNPERVNVPASKGAGQYRALGRMITLSQLSRVASAVREARRQITGAEVTGELKTLTSFLGGKERTVAPDPQVVVVTSIAGGSGSGAVVDVCDVIRSLGDKWANESVGILYSPDVFDDLDEGLRRGVRPNSLAALTETMNGYWSTQGPSVSTSDLFQAAGVSTGANRRLGPRFPFLVGVKNESVTYKTQNDVYKAMGRSISAWMTSASLQDRLSAYTQAQWPSTAQAVTDHLRLHPGGTETPFTALGSARVGLGRDRFRDYSSQYIARRAVSLVLDHHERRRGREDERPATQLIQEQATQVFGHFVKDAGLAERGPDDNDIIDGLQDHQALTSEVDQLAQQLIGRVAEARQAKGFSTDDLRRTIRNEVLSQQDAFALRAIDARRQRSQKWVEEIDGRVCEAVATAITNYGGRVAAVLVRQLISELEYVQDELRNEAMQMRDWAADLDRLIGLQSNRQVTEHEIEESIRSAVRVLEFEHEAEVRELAVQLIPHLRTGLLAPLAEAVERGVEALSEEVTGGLDGRGSMVSSWPEGDIVPTVLRPAPNEFLLERYEEFPVRLSELIERTVGATPADGVDEARDEAVRQVLRGGLAEEPQQMVQQRQRWVPPLEEVSGARAPSNASFGLDISAGDLLARAEQWVMKDSTPIGNHLREGLRTYLDPDKVSPTKHAERVQQFENQFIAALSAGAPLVNVNTAVLTRAHNRELEYSVQFSEIPLPERSPARAALVRTLEARKLYGPSVEQAFSDRDAQFVDIFTVLAEPYEPAVFDSLMRPIMSDWGAKRSTPVDREEFWRWRRARPLPEALPLHPATLDAMVRGWFIAGALEQVQLKPLGIFAEANGQSPAEVVPFESPLLSGTGRGPEALPEILESLAIALVRVNAEESLTPLRPYHRLLDLGEGASHDVPEALRMWIEDGRRAQSPAPDTRTAAERQGAVVAYLERVANNFDKHFKQLESNHETLGYPGSYDLRHHIRSALGDLVRAVATFSPGADDEFV